MIEVTDRTIIGQNYRFEVNSFNDNRTHMYMTILYSLYNKDIREYKI